MPGYRAPPQALDVPAGPQPTLRVWPQVCAATVSAPPLPGLRGLCSRTRALRLCSLDSLHVLCRRVQGAV